jgi:hypothetical protein
VRHTPSNVFDAINFSSLHQIENKGGWHQFSREDYTHHWSEEYTAVAYCCLDDRGYLLTKVPGTWYCNYLLEATGAAESFRFTMSKIYLYEFRRVLNTARYSNDCFLDIFATRYESANIMLSQ